MLLGETFSGPTGVAVAVAVLVDVAVAVGVAVAVAVAVALDVAVAVEVAVAVAVGVAASWIFARKAFSLPLRAGCSPLDAPLKFGESVNPSHMPSCHPGSLKYPYPRLPYFHPGRWRKGHSSQPD